MFFTDRMHRNLISFIASMVGMLADSVIKDMEKAGIDPKQTKLTRKGLRDVESAERTMKRGF